MKSQICRARVRKAVRLMKRAGIDVLLLTKPANQYYLTGVARQYSGPIESVGASDLAESGGGTYVACCTEKCPSP